LKSLTLLNYLLKNGSEKCVTSSREHLYDLKSLETFTFVDENGKDQGINIRIKAKELVEFIQDDDRIREERKKAKKNRDKYVGIDSEFVSSNKIGGFSDFSSSAQKTSQKSSFNDLDDKEWRTSNPSIQERITDITSKVKNILEKTPDTKDNNIEFSDDEFENNAKPKFNAFSDEINKNKIQEPNKVCFFSYFKYKKLK
jgi:clathrin interactor 1